MTSDLVARLVRGERVQHQHTRVYEAPAASGGSEAGAGTGALGVRHEASSGGSSPLASPATPQPVPPKFTVHESLSSALAALRAGSGNCVEIVRSPALCRAASRGGSVSSQAHLNGAGN